MSQQRISAKVDEVDSLSTITIPLQMPYYQPFQNIIGDHGDFQMKPFQKISGMMVDMTWNF